MKKRPTPRSQLAQVIPFPSPLDWSGHVDANLTAIEHVFDATEVVSLHPDHNRDSEGTPWKALDADVDRLRHSPAGPACPNTEQADGLVSPGAHMPPSLPTAVPPATTRSAAASVPDVTGNRSTDIGTLAHRLIALHAAAVSTAGYDTNLMTVLQESAYESIRAVPARRRVLAIQSMSHAYRYLTSYVPQYPWMLLGTEYPCSTGRVDAAWQHSVTGVVFFDEVKTSATAAVRRIPASWVKQSRRYSMTGRDRFGDAFIGTRLLPVATPHNAVLIRAEGAPVLMAPVPGDPLRVKEVAR